MSLVYLDGTNPWLPLFIGFDEDDSGESAGEVTEQLDLQSRTTVWAQIQIKPPFRSSSLQHTNTVEQLLIMVQPGRCIQTRDSKTKFMKRLLTYLRCYYGDLSS